MTKSRHKLQWPMCVKLFRGYLSDAIYYLYYHRRYINMFWWESRWFWITIFWHVSLATQVDYLRALDCFLIVRWLKSIQSPIKRAYKVWRCENQYLTTMTGDCSIFNPVLLPYLPIYKTILSGIFSYAYFKRKVFFHQIGQEKSAAYYIRARSIVGQIRYGILSRFTSLSYFSFFASPNIICYLVK